MDSYDRARHHAALLSLRARRLAGREIHADDWALVEVARFGAWWVTQAQRNAEEAETAPVRVRRTG